MVVGRGGKQSCGAGILNLIPVKFSYQFSWNFSVFLANQIFAGYLRFPDTCGLESWGFTAIITQIMGWRSVLMIISVQIMITQG